MLGHNCAKDAVYRVVKSNYSKCQQRPPSKLVPLAGPAPSAAHLLSLAAPLHRQGSWITKQRTRNH